MEYTQEPMFYTEDELQARLTNARLADALDHAHQTQRAKDNTNFNCALVLEEELRNAVSADKISAEDANQLFANIAGRLGWQASVDFTTKVWTVTVSCNYDEIAVITDIEAEDEDEAIDNVRDNFDIYDVSATATFEYEGNTYSYEVSSVEHDLGDYFTDNLEFEATRQG
jgi:hypothetical protein